MEAADFKERCEKSKVPVDLPLRFTDLWLKFSEAPFPVCEFTPARWTSPGLLPQVPGQRPADVRGPSHAEVQGQRAVHRVPHGRLQKGDKVTTTSAGGVKATSATRSPTSSPAPSSSCCRPLTTATAASQRRAAGGESRVAVAAAVAAVAAAAAVRVKKRAISLYHSIPPLNISRISWLYHYIKGKEACRGTKQLCYILYQGARGRPF